MHWIARFIAEALVLPLAPFISAFQRGVVERFRRYLVEDWTLVNATVHSARIFDLRNEISVEIAYSYSFQGEFFSGYSKYGFGHEEDANRFVSRFQSGSVMVRVSPMKPERSKLLLSDNQPLQSAYSV